MMLQPEWVEGVTGSPHSKEVLLQLFGWWSE